MGLRMNVLQESYVMAAAYLQRQYPPFVYSATNQKNYLPIFYYHHISGSEFENHLRYLSLNGYSSLSCAETMDRIFNNDPQNGRQVMLTFDDGLASFYTEVFPLLKKYRTKAVAYIVSAWIGQPGFLSWQQCREMHQSGLVDIQSHSQTHSCVITSLEIKTIKTISQTTSIPWDIPGIPIKSLSHFYWAPVFEGKSLFEANSSYVLPDSYWKECQIFQHEYAISGRLDHLDRIRLKRKYHQILQAHFPEISKNNHNDISISILQELRTSKHTIEREISNHEVLHFAFPWHTHSQQAWTALKNVGYISGAVGLRASTDKTSFVSDVLKLFRINADFLPCLAGKRRKTFYEVLKTKLARRFLALSKR